MRKSIYIAILAIMGLSSCSSQKKLQTNPPFEIEGPTYQKWTGGQEESGSGLEIKIPIRQILDETFILKQLYFRGRVTNISIEMSNGERYAIGKYSQDQLEKSDIIMHSDSNKEVGNQPPKLNQKELNEFPFKIGNDEAILSYTKKDGKKVKFMKISGLREKQPIIYSSKPLN